jgi:hypothetical protein
MSKLSSGKLEALVQVLLDHVDAFVEAGGDVAGSISSP